MVNILLLLVLQTQVTGSQATGSIAGRVRSSAGQPLANAVVSIGVAQQVRADSLGHYQLDAVPVGMVRVMAWAYGYQTANQDAQVTRRQQVRMDFVLDTLGSMLVPTGSVYGVVRDTTGHPMSGVSVYLSGERHILSTDFEGRYHFPAVAPGPVHISANRIGYKRMRIDTTLAPGQPLPLDFVLPTQAVKLFSDPVTSP